MADRDAGLPVLPSVPDVEFTVREDAATNLPITIDAATDFSYPLSSTPLFTTTVVTRAFDSVDFDVKLTNKLRKYDRGRQP